MVSLDVGHERDTSTRDYQPKKSDHRAEAVYSRLKHPTDVNVIRRFDPTISTFAPEDTNNYATEAHEAVHDKYKRITRLRTY